jgi:PAS domain S-box-containing protein
MDAAVPPAEVVLDALPDVVFATDEAGVLTYLSPAWTGLTGHPVEESLGTPLGDHLEVAAGGGIRCITAWGGVRWVEVRATDRPGGGRCGTLVDVTERQRAGARLAEAESRFRGAFDHAATGMAILAADGRPLRVNTALCRLAGRTADELLELPLGDLLHPDDVATEQLHWDRLMAGDIPAFDIEARLVRPDGDVVWTRQTVALVRDDEDVPLYAVSQLQDVTAARRAAERLARRALHDAGTGLPSESLFHDRLGQALARTRRSGRLAGVLRCAVAGAPLEEAAARLNSVLRPGDTVARLGEEELGIVLEGLRDQAEAELVAGRVELALSGLAVRLGVATAGEGETVPGQLVADAAAAARGAEESRLQQDLRRALELGELRLAFQPVVALGDGRIAGMEALLRWDDPRHGLRLPGEFLSAAAAAGLLESFGAWVIAEGCRALAGWRAAGLADDLTLSINLSPSEARREGLPDLLAGALRDVGLPAGCLLLEVGEDGIAPAAMPRLRALARVGVRLTVDDFGAGAAAFQHVTRVPGLGQIKVDKALVRGAAASREDAAVLAAVISLGRSLGVEIVAEGLETAAEVRLLRDLGCTLGLGFWFGRPQPAAEVEQLLRRGALGELGI